MNDKIIGMICVTIMFLAVVFAWAIVDKPIDPTIEKLGGMIISGMMGTMIGFNIARKVKNIPK